jgi:hypothetical protein
MRFRFLSFRFSGSEDSENKRLSHVLFTGFYYMFNNIVYKQIHQVALIHE